ncbi:hypothetical protein [Streptococcus danieliae]|uniref:V-type ATP synthase subunit G n=1 Tax=Streptococcus danieliae TaxID=747656 RepID=A0A7Z0S5N7_9STRE|nr:hypothetical protein [Streptococcus danieliae]MBF0700238.1 hypothetical protein [Streptococcus danieliae]NYS97414.1 hypothetical protein [Streptococcus danieliae]
MSDSIFTTMESIEREAQLIVEEYEKRIQEATLKSKQELSQLLQERQAYYQKEYEQLAQQLSSDKQALDQEVADKIQANEQTIQQVSMNYKTEFVEKIVSRVVAYYGH